MGRLAVILLTVMVVTTFFSIHILLRYYNRTRKRSLSKLSDREFLAAFAMNNYVLSIPQLQTMSSLTSMELSMRMQAWMNLAAFRTLYDGSDQVMYQLKANLPQLDRPLSTANKSSKELLEAFRPLHSGREINIAELVWVFDLELNEARKLLQEWVKLDYLKSYYDSNLQRYYSFKEQELKGDFRLAQEVEAQRIELDDASLLKLAIEHGGKLTVSQLCLKTKSSLDEAQDRLDELYDKGVFFLDIDEQKGKISYVLREQDLKV